MRKKWLLHVRDKHSPLKRAKEFFSFVLEKKETSIIIKKRRPRKLNAQAT